MLKIKNLSFGYGKEHIITDLNLTVEKNSIISILGDSGSGKSTLLRLICGLEQTSSGKIIVDGVDVTNIPAEFRKVGMVFQDYALFPHMTVYQNVSYCVKKKEDFKLVDELLNITDIYRYKDKYPYELSGGEKQRVALSRAICYKPKILLLDEPFSNLDESLKSTLRLKVKSILEHYNITSILVTHDKEDANTISDVQYYMKKGVIMDYKS